MEGQLRRGKRRIALMLVGAIAFATAALLLLEPGLEAGSMLAAQDDPAELADRALDKTFNAALATREIEAALTAGDADLAKSLVELAKERAVPIAPALLDRVDEANSASASATRSAQSFARGLITGEPDDVVGLAGTTLGDLFVFGDIRDALREGSRFASGQQADELVLGLACVGLAITAGTYATFGAAAPARVGVSVVKAARRTGRIGSGMAEWIGRTLREVVDWSALRRAFAQASVTEPALAVRAAREAVKVEKADNLVRLVSDVGRVQAKAGTQAALDGLKLAEGPRDVARVAKLAEKKAGKTRAILKVLGQGALGLAFAAFDLALWMFWAALTLFGFVSAAKSATERATARYLARRRLRRLRKYQQELGLVLHR